MSKLDILSRIRYRRRLKRAHLRLTAKFESLSMGA